MKYLNPKWNSSGDWARLEKLNRMQVEVDLHEVERVIELARRTPDLAGYDDLLQQVMKFFRMATLYYREKAPGVLEQLVSLWDKYRAAFIQRYTAVTPTELRAADKVVHDVFDRFLAKIPNENIAYTKNARPLVFGGEGGIGSYYTYSPDWNRPFAIINLPHAAFDNVWQWLALPHETGHDLYAVVNGLAGELEAALAAVMSAAVANNDLQIPDVDVDLEPAGYPHRIKYSGKDLITTIWKNWANECQADITGLLSCGGAAPAALQQIIGFKHRDYWLITPASATACTDAPEVHPTSYLRNVLNFEALKLIDPGHQEFAGELETRFKKLCPAAAAIEWYPVDEVRQRLITAEPAIVIPAEQMIKSAQVAAEILINHKFQALGNQSYRDLITFTAGDQEIVDTMVDGLLQGNPVFAQVDNATPRHALAATVLAFEKQPELAVNINMTFKHFM